MRRRRVLAEEGKQVAFMRASKAIVSLRFSDDGRYLAVGERGHRPAITVWDVQAHKQIAQLKEGSHRFGISAMAFSPSNPNYLVSVGFKHDGSLILWDWQAGEKLCVKKLNGKVFAVDFAADGEQFVTVGQGGHVKFWHVGVAASTGDDIVPIEQHRAGIMPAYRKAVFVDVACGRGNLAGTTYAVTSCGSLVVFSANRLMEKWVELDCPSAHALSIWHRPSRGAAKRGDEDVLAAACGGGITRLFRPKTLEYLATLPPPQPITGAAQLPGRQDAILPLDEAKEYPACLCARFDAKEGILSIIYSDRSFMVWDVSDPSNVALQRSFLHHSACVWGVDIVRSSIPEATFQRVHL